MNPTSSASLRRKNWKNSCEEGLIMRGRLCTLVAVLGLSGGVASAASTAADNAANYGGGWGLTPANLGSGFGPWTNFVTNNNNPPYAGTYGDNSSTTISTSTYSWGTYANSATTAIPRVDLVRPFVPAGGGYSDPSTLGTLYNQTFSLAMQTYGVGSTTSSFFGFSLDTGQGVGATATPVLTLEYLGGMTDNMTLTDNDGTNLVSSVPLNFADINGGLLVSVAVGFNPDGFNPYTLTVSPAPGNSAFSTPYVFSNFTNGPIQQVDMFGQDTDQNGFFNSLAVSAELPVPEPATMGLVGGLAVLLLNRRGRRSV
jgi:hypothetical protein